MKKHLLMILMCVCIALTCALVSCNSEPEPTEEPTETEETEFVCTEHIYEWSIDVAPTCTEDGVNVATCIYCKDQKTEAIPAGHDIEGREAKEPTCKEIGWDAYDVCLNCDYTTYVEKPMAHKLEDGVCVFCEKTPIDSAEGLKDIKMDGSYILTCDVDLGGAEWTPIGTKDDPFVGSFDGKGFTVSNYKITVPHAYTGFFGCIADTAEINDLSVKDFTIDIDGFADEQTGLFVGGLVGGNTGDDIVEIFDCSAAGEIKVNSVYGGISDDPVGCWVGGLVGYVIEMHIERSISEVAVSVSTDNYIETCVGGLIGAYHSWRIENCYTSSAVSVSTVDGSICVGGIVGSTSGFQQNKLQNCYTTGSVYARSVSGEILAGGVVGYGEATYCYSTCSVTAESQSGLVLASGIVGATGPYTYVSHCFTTGRVSSSGYVGGVIAVPTLNPELNGPEGLKDYYMHAGLCYYVAPNADYVTGDTVSTWGTKVTLDDLKSDTLFTDSGKLAWDDTIWSFGNGELPTLKCFEEATADTQ